MRVLRLLPALVALALPLRAEESRTGGTLAEITRGAEARLRQWDEDDAQDQRLESKYWWLGFVQLALSITFGRGIFPVPGLDFSHNPTTPHEEQSHGFKN